MDVIDEIVAAVGSQTALAKLCSVTPQAVSKWRRNGIPPKQCRVIEAATGVPSAKQRPDVFGMRAADTRLSA